MCWVRSQAIVGNGTLWCGVFAKSCGLTLPVHVWVCGCVRVGILPQGPNTAVTDSKDAPLTASFPAPEDRGTGTGWRAAHCENRLWKHLCWLLLWDSAMFAKGVEEGAEAGSGPPRDVWVQRFQTCPLDWGTLDFYP